MPEIAPHEQIMNVIAGLWQSHALAVAVELKLADLLAEGPLPLHQLAARSNANPGMLHRLLRALETIGIFKQISPGVYSNTAVSEAIRTDVPGSQWAWARQQLTPGFGSWELWKGLTATVHTGVTDPKPILGCTFWEFLEKNPEVNQTFNTAIQAVSVKMTPAITAAYDWTKSGLIADIGGGIGAQLVSILDAAPHVRGILFDQKHVLTMALPHSRMKVMSGDFFKQVPEADLYILRAILHDWDDERASHILKTIRKAAKPESRLIAAEVVLTEGPELELGKWSDLLMALLNGKERTSTEHSSLMSASGWTVEEVKPTASPMQLIVARPA